MAPEQQTDRADVDPDAGLGELIRTDLARLHTAWMDLVFPRQREPHPVLGKWTPSTTPERASYRLWAALGLAIILLAYPLAVVGFAVRFYSRRLYGTARVLGLVGVLVLSAVVWGALTVGVYLRDFSPEGIAAVAAGGSVAVVSAGLATVFSRRGGRASTVVLAYPFAVTAIFLPPVVAALYSPTLATWVFPNSYTLAVWLLDNPLSVAGIATFLRANFTLVGVAYAAMWFGIAVPVGWALGLLVTLADVIRPTD